eukprot:m.41032 g.41032  ORF g.41032 m.41032 type:complete len:307 (+) comp6065_c0_seq2:105-1025(+)
MSYNNIGLASVRGSGTNGYVQRNFSHVRKRKETQKYGGDFGSGRSDKLLTRKPNAELLEHEAKRGIEVKCVEMQDLMEEQGYPDDEIEEKVDELRKQLLADYEKRKAAEAEGKGNDTGKQRKIDKFGSAMGIDDAYETGAAFKGDWREKKRAAREEEYKARQAERERRARERDAERAAERARRESKRDPRSVSPVAPPESRKEDASSSGSSSSGSDDEGDARKPRRRHDSDEEDGDRGAKRVRASSDRHASRERDERRRHDSPESRHRDRDAASPRGDRRRERRRSSVSSSSSGSSSSSSSDSDSN